MARASDDIDDARNGGQIAALGLIGQGAMLVEAEVMIVGVELSGNGARLHIRL
jgi:hypothetical protein